MARFPIYERSQGLGGGATASYASDSAFTAPGRAMQGLGRAIAGAGNQLAAQLERTQTSRDDAWLAKRKADTLLQQHQYEIQAKQNATGNAANYAGDTVGHFEQYRRSVYNDAPSPEAAAKYEAWSYTQGRQVGADAATFAATSALSQRSADFATAMEDYTKVVYADPSKYMEVVKNASDDFEAAKAWMTPEQEAKMRPFVTEQLNLAKNKADIARDPAEWQRRMGLSKSQPVPPKSYNDRTSEGKYWNFGNNFKGNSLVIHHTGGRGTVDGVIQTFKERGFPAHYIIDRTGNIHQVLGTNQKGQHTKPSEINDISNSNAWGVEIIANDDNDVLPVQVEAAKQLAKDLQSHGLDPSRIVGHGEINSHKRKTEGQTVINAIRNGATVSASEAANDSKQSFNPNINHPQMVGLSVDQIMALNNQAEAQIAENLRTANAQQANIAAQAEGAIRLGIATGDPSISVQSILSAPLDQKTQATLIEKYQAKNKDNIAIDRVIDGMDSGAAFNKFDSDTKKGVEGLYKRIAGDADVLTDQNAARSAYYLTGKTGIIPQPVVQQMRSGLASGDAGRVAAAAQMAANIRNENSQYLDGFDGSSELTEAAIKFQHLTESLGLSPDEAGQRMIDMTDPEKQKQREAYAEAPRVKKAIKDITTSDVQDVFDPGVFGFEPDFASDGAADIMLSEYKEMFKEGVIESAGDLEQAKKLTDDRFRKIYGASDLTLAGSDVITPYPPEVLFPAGPNGGHEWIKVQLETQLSDALQSVEFDDVRVQATEDTKRTKAYQVYYRQGDTWHMFPGEYKPDASKMDMSVNLSEYRRRNKRGREQEQQRQQIIDTYGSTGTTPLDEMKKATDEFKQQMSEQ